MQMKNVPFTYILKCTVYVFCNIIMVYIYMCVCVCVCVCVCTLDSTSLLRNILNIELS